jgi:molybdopterin-binding protein
MSVAFTVAWMGSPGRRCRASSALTVISTTSARNTWPGTVGAIDRLGDRVRVSVDGRLPLVAEITVSALEALHLRPGDPIHATVKATDIEVYPA